MIVFIGNTTERRLYNRNDRTLENFAARAYNQGCILAAYGQGVELLADSGLLRNGVRATADALSRRTVRQNGGTYVDEPIVVDGRIITAQSDNNTGGSNIETGLSGSVGLATQILKELKEE